MSTYHPDYNHRRSIRLKGYDYRQTGAYFVTLCAYQREQLFGRVVAGRVELNKYGQIVQFEWLKSAVIRREIEMDALVIMPNHLHGIVVINEARATDHGRVGATDHHCVGATGRSPLHDDGLEATNGMPHGPLPGSLGACMAGFKSTVTRQINQLRQTPGVPVWQRNYYEHVIRNESALTAIREYIVQNPVHWEFDRYNPIAAGRDLQAVTLWNLLQER